MDPANSLSILVDTISDLSIQERIETSSLALFAYEYLITLSEEIEKVWKQPWTSASILFMLNRYYTMLELLAVALISFNPAWISKGAGAVVVVAFCEATMILRIYALYGRRLRILLVLCFCLAVQVTLQGIALAQSHSVPAPVGCLLVGKSSFFSVFWIAPLVMESIIFIMTMWRSRRYFYQGSLMPAMRVFLLDGAAYFLVVFTANLINVIIFLHARSTRKVWFAPISEVVTSIVVSRYIDWRIISDLVSPHPTDWC
ncbi:hypothetical protein PUNSTDRAFT_134577 [Punctularia strigosozonata HHB-11173 SS5]|uniref:uncharacterized protein n=1 Tax=Punctularia strigosozonata (strain HHB-11173) TaxID=741275 RepID=UPI0004417256|nr:uncharacterized protein PUNSTDRAFT_134577 [Punctularia strigosozonata HHB-11173 SS5]EIN08183.1 hypothetical protein PUNSTDRAFT_134577 [Punctularia strigosozonata HHB-11173 SS5]